MSNFRTILFWIGSTFICYPAFSQKSKTAIGEYQMKVENSVAWNDAVSFATNQAQINAIENIFGKVISQESSSYIQNKQEGKTVQTNTTFNFISNSYVKGEWVENIDEPQVERLTKENETWIKVTVKGKVREVIALENSFIADVLSCPDVKCKTRKFNDGQDLLLYFKTSEDGFLSVFLTDPSLKYTFMLLPYKGSVKNKKNIPVKADKDYVFFSKKFDYLNELDAIDEQIVSVGPNSTSEKYQMWVLFSKDELEKPILESEEETSRKFLDANLIKTGYSLPKGMNEDKYRDWLQSYRVHNKNVQLLSIFFDVNKQ